VEKKTATAALRTRVGYCFRLSIDRFAIEDKTVSDEAGSNPGGDDGGW